MTTWMSVSAQRSSSARAASTAARISGAATDALTEAASVSTAERNSIRSASPIAPSRDTSCRPARHDLPPGAWPSKARGAWRRSMAGHCSCTLACAAGCSELNSTM